MPTLLSAPQARARAVEFVPDAFVVHLEDGRSLTVPIEWFPRLHDATPEQRSNGGSSVPVLASTGPTSTRTSPSPDCSACQTDVPRDHALRSGRFDLGPYKGLVPPWNDWAHLAARGRHWAGVLAVGLLGGGAR